MLKDCRSYISSIVIASLALSTSSNGLAQEWDMFYGDLVLYSKAESMKESGVDAVLFPHWFHRIRFRCKVCHEGIFKQKKGANDISMGSITRGEHCGTCHDGKVAWDPLYCDRCHVVKMDLVKEADAKHTLRPKGEVNINPKAEPGDPASVVYTSKTGELKGRGLPRKPAGEAFRWGSGWQPKALKEDIMPRDRFGLVDWVRATRLGMIHPKGSLNPEDLEYKAPVRFEYKGEYEDVQDIVIKTKSMYVNDILFPHTLHAWWLECKSCHPRRFGYTTGDTAMAMKEMSEGKYCGECHGKVSFPLSDCNRCHSVKRTKLDR